MRMSYTFQKFLLSILILAGIFLYGCAPAVTISNLQNRKSAIPEETPFQPIAQDSTPKNQITATQVIQALPGEYQSLKIDGVAAIAEYLRGRQAWVWKDKKGSIRRLLDPLSGHLLVRTQAVKDRLAYEIDYAFKWEVNLVNYDIYPTHAPFGLAYIKLLKNKYPVMFSQANDQTGIVFRIIKLQAGNLPNTNEIVTLMDAGNEKERYFLNPSYLAGSNEFVLTMGLSTDFLIRKGAINTYTEEMLNFCLSPLIPANRTGAWGIEVYKHTIK